MARVYVSVGSNVNQEENVRNGVRAVADQYGELILSSVYQSRAVGFEGDDFYNMVLAFDTELPVEQVAAQLRQIEERFGRLRGCAKFSSRTLDLDILLYGDLVLESGSLILPRQEITENAHVLQPLAEIAPELKHPLLGKSYHTLWEGFEMGDQHLVPIPMEF